MSDNPDYNSGLRYWNAVQPSNNGVLGGYGNGTLPRTDSLSTRIFLLSLLPRLSAIQPAHATTPVTPPAAHALDCGAGIGRVSKDVLIHLVSHIDLLEPATHFLKAARDSAQSWNAYSPSTKGLRFFNYGLQAFNPAKASSYQQFGHQIGRHDGWTDSYDIILIQWCIGHLTDDEMVLFLQQSKHALAPDGFIFLKENICSDNEPNGRIFDKEDSSLTRSDATFQQLFTKAGLKVIKQELQLGLPDGLLPVHMYALR